MATHVTPFDPTFEEGMRVFERVNTDYRHALRELAPEVTGGPHP